MNTILHTRIDHLVIAAPSLAIGTAYVADTLGVAPVVGGEHPRMGTHNALLRLGPDQYIEIIAKNPNAPSPNRARWLELDRLNQNTLPRLWTWVASTTDIHAAASATSFEFGTIEAMSRGSFSWLIAFPEDGSLPMQGIAPTLIEWSSGNHPTSNLPDTGCSLIRLEGYHPRADALSELLGQIGFDSQLSVFPLPEGEPPRLVAVINTPTGQRTLASR